MSDSPRLGRDFGHLGFDREALPVEETIEAGKLFDNVLHFARTLRAAGLPLGPGQVIRALEALSDVGLARRDDVYWALHAVFVSKRQQREIFDQAFHLFWRNPKLLDRFRALLLPTVRPDRGEDDDKPLARRLSDLLIQKPGEAGSEAEETKEKIEIDALLTWSDREQFQSKDFESMTQAEMTEAKAAMAKMKLPFGAVKTRRFRPDQRGRIDQRRSLRLALRGQDTIPLVRKARRLRPPPLVALCDISGSMSRYSRVLLHFLHAVTNDRDRVHSFLFGTRLSNVSRALKQRDVDLALSKVGKEVPDWDGGTRIGHALEEFNRKWARRVLPQGAVVILITDGLDRAGAEGVAKEIERLHKSCRRLIWLNPLLRYEGYEPKSQGAKALLPQVDEFRPVHNLESLGALIAALAKPAPARLSAAKEWRAK